MQPSLIGSILGAVALCALAVALVWALGHFYLVALAYPLWVAGVGLLAFGVGIYLDR